MTTGEMEPATERRAVCRVILTGGLGNQFFQYAAAAAIASRSESDIEIDDSFYQRRHQRHRTLEITQFPISGRLRRDRQPTFLQAMKSSWGRFAGNDLKSYREPHLHFDEGTLSLQAPISIQGYFQSERYFQAIAPSIREQFRVPRPMNPKVLAIGDQLHEAATLHIRRGDYVSSEKNRSIYAQCTLDYYRAAVERLPSDVPVYVLSDDMDWVRRNFKIPHRLNFPESETALEDLWLMTQARHHVIANSTFSWWGAWLAKATDGIKIAPRKWFCDETINDIDLVPPHWLRL
jgi:hypothetical protein